MATVGDISKPETVTQSIEIRESLLIRQLSKNLIFQSQKAA